MKVVVKQVVVKQRLSWWELIRYQIHTWCSFRHIQITNSDLELLSLLSLIGETDLTSFCIRLASTEPTTGVKVRRIQGRDKEFKYIFNSPQSARNAVAKLIKLKLIDRKGKGNIKISLSKEIEVYTESNLLINYQLLSIEPNKSEDTNTQSS